MSYERFVPSSSDSVEEGFVSQASGLESMQHKNITFKNRFLNFVKLGSVLNNAAESFFKSEIRRRIFYTAVLLVISRIGYFIPLPGFDRRLIPENYLSFASGSVGKSCFVYFYAHYFHVILTNYGYAGLVFVVFFVILFFYMSLRSLCKWMWRMFYLKKEDKYFFITSMCCLFFMFADELGDWSPELKLSFFQLGISPQIAASIIMQVC